MSDIINPSSGGGIDLSLSGNTTGTLALISSGTGILAGGNNITLSQNGQSITISAANSSQSVQTQNLINLSLGGNTAGVLTLVSSGTALLAGGNNITLSQNGQSITISGANAAAGSAAAVAIGGNSTSAGAGYSTVTSGTALFAGGNNITLSQAGSNISIVGATIPAQTNQTLGLYAESGTIYTTSTTQDARSLSFVGSGIISVGFSSGSVVFDAAAGAQTVQTQNCVDVTIDTNANYVGTPVLISSGTAIWAGGNNITLSQNGQEITIVGPNTVAQTNQTIGYSAENNTTLTTSGTIDARSLYLYGAGNVSVGFSSSSLIISGGGAAGGVDISLSGNTAGTPALISSGTAIFAGGNNITLSQNGQSITIEAPAAGAAATTMSYYELDVARGATSTQTTGAGTVYLQPFVVSAPLQIYRGQILGDVTSIVVTTFSIGIANSTGAISTSAGGTTSHTSGYSGSWGLSGTVMLLRRQSTGTAAASSNLVTFYTNSTSMSLGLSVTASASSTNGDFLTANVSSSAQIAFISNIDSAGNITTGANGTTTSYTLSVSSAAQSTITVSTVNSFASLYMSGVRPLNFPMNTALSPGEYWFGLIFSSSSGSASANLANCLSLTHFLQVFTSNTNGFLPFGSSASTNNSNVQMGWGSYSSSGNTSTTFPITNVSNMSQEQTWFNLMAWTL